MNILSQEFETILSAQVEKILREKLDSLIPKGKKEKQIDPAADEYVSRKRAAEILNVCLTTLYYWAKQGKIQTYRIGNRVLIKRKDIDGSLSPINYK